MPAYLCAFDLGTTGVKAGILTPTGELVAYAYREYPVAYPGPRCVEQSIEAMWAAQCEASRQALDRCNIDPHEIAAVGISSQRATFVPVDRDENPLMRFIGWQDRRSLSQCAEMERRVGAERYYSIAGLPIEPTAAVSKILWLKENEPRIFERADKFASTQNVHLHQLGVSNAPCDLPDAAYLGLLDVDRLEWSGELLAVLGIPAEKLPALAASGTQVGEVSRIAAEATGLAPGTPLVLAGGDLQTAGLGMGISEPGYVSVGIGTGGGVLIYLEKPLRHPERALNCLPHAVAGAWEMEGICLASGAAYKWYRDTAGQLEKATATALGLDAYDLLNLEAAQATPGGGGVLVMPALAGSGAPNWYPGARGVILGLSLSSDKKQLGRALLEGICLEIRWMLEAAQMLGTAIAEVRIWGGAAKSDLWNQIAADVYGVQAARTEIPEAGLVGAAICAGVGVGIFSNAHEGARQMVRVEKRYVPDPKLRARYNELFDLYKLVYKLLKDGGVFERLQALA
jgi:xylulokinase